jgi:hypothetical protein
MAAFITAQAMTLAALLDGTRRFELPWFQRTYAWGTEHAGRLLTDTYREAVEGARGYSLGMIRLAGAAENRASMLVDGHQRLMTLTILFALLRDLSLAVSLPRSARIAELIYAPDRNGRASGAILLSQSSVAEFVLKYVQTPGGTLTEPPGDLSNLTQPARNVLENRNHMRAVLMEMSPAEREKLTTFLLERCWVVVTEVEDEDEAWAMLANEEATGLDFHAADRTKISLLSVMPPDTQAETSEIWEHWQSRLGTDGVADLLKHIRNLTLRRRSKHPIERDLNQRLRLDRNGLDFMRTTFARFAGHLLAVRQRRLTAQPLSIEAERRLDTLAWVGHTLWELPLLAALESGRYDTPAMELLLHRLDRMTWLLKIAAVEVPDQERRFIRLSEELRAGKPVAGIDALQIEASLRKSAAQRMAEKNFYLKSCCQMILRRLNLIAGQLHGPVDGIDVTIEHVLPHGALERPEWRRDFKPHEIDASVNKLGNLVLLAFKENQQADTHGFEVKRPILQNSSFAITVAAGTEPRWTVETIERRTQAAIDTMMRDLDATPGG